MTVYSYPIPGNRKSLAICTAFALGCGGQVVHDNMFRPGDAFFYGVNELNALPWQHATTRRAGEFFYADNSYFDATRQTYFRVTRNRLQHTGVGRASPTRWRHQSQLYGIDVKPWRQPGDDKHIVVCEQSETFMRMPAMYDGNWLRDTVDVLARVSRRPVVVRRWARDKARPADPLIVDLQNAHALITHSSAAAITALVQGVPVVVHSNSAAAPYGGSITDLENLPLRPDRGLLFDILANNQFTMDELRNGYAWSRLV